MPAPRHVFQTYIRATPEAVWQAITDPDFTRRYFHRTAIESTWQRGARLPLCPARRHRRRRGRDRGDRPAAPARRDVARAVRRRAGRGAAEPRRVAAHAGRRRRHAGDDDPPRPGAQPEDVGERRRRLDVGARLAEVAARDRRAAARPGARSACRRGGVDDAEGEWHRRMGVDANNSTWELLGRDDLSADEADDLLGRAYTAAHHWRRAARRGPENAARASWLLSRAHAVLGHGDAGAAPRRPLRRARRRRPGSPTSTSPTPTRPGPAPSPASVASTRPPPSWPRRAPCRSPTTTTAPSSTTSPRPWYGLRRDPCVTSASRHVPAPHARAASYRGA